MENRFRPATESSPGDFRLNLTSNNVGASSPHLCVDCVNFALDRVQFPDRSEPYCHRHGSYHFALVPAARSCELFEHRMLSAKEVAKMFGVEDKMIRRLAEEWQDSGGKQGLRGIKVGKVWRFCREDARAYLDTRFRLAAGSV